MRKAICHLALLLCFTLCITSSQAQVNRKVSAYASFQYTHTLYDITLGNNPWAFGVGAQAFFNNRHIIKPMVDLSADAYLEDDKVYRGDYDQVTGEFKETPDLGTAVNMFAGIAVQPVKPLFLSFTAGPSFLSGRTCFGIKPSVGVYLTKTQTVMLRAAYINVFNRDKETGSDFGSVSFGLGIKLF